MAMACPIAGLTAGQKELLVFLAPVGPSLSRVQQLQVGLMVGRGGMWMWWLVSSRLSRPAAACQFYPSLPSAAFLMPPISWELLISSCGLPQKVWPSATPPAPAPVVPTPPIAAHGPHLSASAPFGLCELFHQELRALPFLQISMEIL